MLNIVPVLALVAISSVHAARWDSTNDPHKLARVTGKALVTRFDNLPRKAFLKDPHIGWSDSYWPSMFGGISYRWNAEPKPENFSYSLLTREQISKMSVSDLERLSPAEKFDIYNGDYSFSLTRKVRGMYTPSDAWWEGICHGWAPASLSHPEPKRVDLKSKDGLVMVPFGATDVKGLISFYYAQVHQTKVYTRLSDRCRARGKVPGEAYPRDRVQSEPTGFRANSLACQGVNPGAFHLALTNVIGIQDKGFVADIDRYADVWNQPIVGFDTKVVGTQAPERRQLAQGIAQVLKVETVMTYSDVSVTLDPDSVEDAKKLGVVSMDPVTGTPQQNYLTRTYEYFLELSASGEIIGGEWISESRPDFIWLKGAASRFGAGKGFNMSSLNEIYSPVID